MSDEIRRIGRPAGPAVEGAGRRGVAGLLDMAPESVRAVEPPKIEHFIGRRDHLTALSCAYRDLMEERFVSVLVRGRAGMGKSALLHHFLMGLRHGEGAVVLRGRCLEGESAPYKAFGSVVTALSRYLRRLPQAEASSLLPRDVHALSRLFPALSQVPAVESAPRAPEAPDAQQLRQRAFAALRQLLWRLAERRPLIVSIEDLQWSDMDSAAMLLDVSRQPGAPAMLFLGSFRAEEVGSSAPLAALLDSLAPPEGGGGGATLLDVGPLGLLEAEELALALLFARDPGSRARADAIARSSEGNPRLVGELVRALQEAPPSGERSSADAAMERALRVRLSRLPDQAMRLLEVVAAAGAPVDPAVALRAAKLSPEDQAPAVALLRSEDLVLARRSGGRDTLEPLHGSMREAIVGRLDPAQLSACHRRLARALEAAGGMDLEVLSTHWLAAGDAGKAGRFAAKAADQAADALAFERAARLYELSLGLLAPQGIVADAVEEAEPEEGAEASPREPRLSGAELRELAIRCGDALVNAGKSAEAALVYAGAAEGAEAALGLELRRRAAEQHLRSGHIDEGHALLREVLRSVGLSSPRTPRRAMVSLLLRRAELRVRGLRFRERSEQEVPPEDLSRIDACWSATVGFSAVDLIRSADFSTRGLLLALRAGEPYRVARALAFEASSACMVGSKNRARASELVSALCALSEREGSPHALGLSMMASGMLEAFAGGSWRSALGWYERADELFRDRCSGVAWELVTTQLLTSWARYYRGQIGVLSQTLPAVLRAAEQRGDLYAIATLSAPAAWVGLAGDDVSLARRTIQGAMSGWSQSGFHLEHFIGLLAETYVDRYAGRPGAALQRLDLAWRGLERSMLLRVQNNRVMAWMERGCTALSAAEGASDPEPLVQAALCDASALSREGTAWSRPFVTLIRAGASALRGDAAGAVARLDEAAAEFDGVDMALYAAAARRQAGELAGGEGGLSRILVADALMARENIKSPARWAAMLAPGFGRRG